MLCLTVKVGRRLVFEVDGKQFTVLLRGTGRERAELVIAAPREVGVRREELLSFAELEALEAQR
jgi:sRNA-binding carbon storage regulator CsrA